VFLRYSYRLLSFHLRSFTVGHIGAEVRRDESVFIHESAYLYGKVSLGAGASIWPNVVIRSEMFEVVIGARSNVQDFAMIHVGFEYPTLVGV
jgi:carbonic anhydrase/acetyltransferase-like protein (isoleucine patch superfamily)